MEHQVLHDAVRRYDADHLLLGDRYKGDRAIPIGGEKVNGLPPDVLDRSLEALSQSYDPVWGGFGGAPKFPPHAELLYLLDIPELSVELGERLIVFGPNGAGKTTILNLIAGTQEPDEGKVVKTTDFGAFVQIMPGTDGLVHISQLANHRVNKVTDVVKEGDMLKVKVLEIGRDGKIRLSHKAVSDDES